MSFFSNPVISKSTMESTRMKQPEQSQSSYKYVALAFVLFAALVPEVAFAQTATDGTSMFCMMAKYFKTLVGAAALLVIFLWSLEHFFGVAKLHSVVITVGVGCAVVTMGPMIITSAGLITCTGI